MSARHVNADTPRSCTIIPTGCCPWCRQPLTTDDRLAAVRVGSELVHSRCADEFDKQEDVYAAAYPLPNGRKGQ